MSVAHTQKSASCAALTANTAELLPTLRNKSVQGWSITVMLAGELKAPDKTAGARKQGAGARGKIYVTCGPFIGRYLFVPDWF